MRTIKSFVSIIRVLSILFLLALIWIYAEGKSVAQEYADSEQESDVVEEESTGYLMGGSAIYGIQEKIVEDDSPLTELKMLRKKYFREVKRRESMEEESKMIKRKSAELDLILRKKDSVIEELKRKLINAEFKYVALEQKLTDLKIAILRKKIIRESSYPVTYEVKINDSLWKIAGRKNIYNDSYKWMEIYYANKNKILDPDYIYPGMFLSVPRPGMENEDWTIKGLDLDSVKDEMNALKINSTSSNMMTPIKVKEVIDNDGTPDEYGLGKVEERGSE